jgi:hypothetical protein
MSTGALVLQDTSAPTSHLTPQQETSLARQPLPPRPR